MPRVVLTPNLQYGRQDPEARTSTDHQSEQSVQYRETCRSLLVDTRRKHLEESQRGKYRETCRGNVDYREAEIISLDAGLRMDGIPAVDLWDLVVEVFCSFLTN